MKDILFDDLKQMILNDELCEISCINSYEKSYDYYEITCDINGESCRITDTRNSRCSDLVFTDTQHQAGHAEFIVKKLKEWSGKETNGEVELKQSWNHNPACWDDNYEYGDEIDYIGDGLDCADDWGEWY